MGKHCIAGSAYILWDWTKEKEWYKRKKVMFCFKCNRRIEYNNRTNRYRHLIKEEELNDKFR